ncbi:hypothetical protein Tco_0371533 [Tanacetum coccineum]
MWGLLRNCGQSCPLPQLVRSYHSAWVTMGALVNRLMLVILDSFYINFAQHVCMVSDLGLRDVEIVALKAKLETAERDSVELGRLHVLVSELEAEVVSKSEEITGLNKQNVELLGEAKPREEFASLQDVAARRFKEKFAKLDARIADVLGHSVRLVVMKCAQSSKCYSAQGKVISLAINKGIQQGLEAEIKHGKAGRSLAQVEAYDPYVENKYVAEVNDFDNVSFSLPEELEALKDFSLALIMSSLTLECDADSTPKLREHSMRSSLDICSVSCVFVSSCSLWVLVLLGHRMLLSDVIPAIRERAEKRGLGPSSSFLKGGVAGVVLVQDSSLGVADYQVSTLVHTGSIGSVAPPHDDLFDTTIRIDAAIVGSFNPLFFGPWCLSPFRLWCFISRITL